MSWTKMLSALFIGLCLVQVRGQLLNESLGGRKIVKEQICANGYCGSISFKAILQMYKGLFYTEKGGHELKALMEKRRLEGLASQKIMDLEAITSLPGDGDACCSTRVELLRNETLPNLENETRYIIQLQDENSEKLYQYIPHGFCHHYGSCLKTCYQEYTTHVLLVYDDKFYPPITFDQFLVPGYCSCKNPARR